MRRDGMPTPTKESVRLEAARMRGRAEGYAQAIGDLMRLRDQSSESKPEWQLGLVKGCLLLQALRVSGEERATRAEAGAKEWEERN